MRSKAALVSITLGLVSLSALSAASQGQEPDGLGGVESVGITSSYSPDSSHILIGEAERRRTWTAGVEYSHLLGSGHATRWDYEASLLPFYQESDPTAIGTEVTLAGHAYISSQPAVRVTYVSRSPIGFVTTNGSTAPVYGLYGRKNTNGGSLSPLGVRATWFQHSRIQPSFSLNLGFLVAARDIPVDNAFKFNFLFSFGPGVQVFITPRSSVRLEYIYRHISNASLGDVNPGIDQGTFRLTLSRHR
jgi:opacity protein-like surface antigen